MPEDVEPLEWNDMLVERFWSFESRRPDNFFANKFGPALTQQVTRHLSPRSHLLDYGSGSGALIPLLINKGFRVTAADISEELVRLVEGRYSSNPLFEGAYQFSDLIPPKEGFDGILAIEVIEHLSDEYLDDMLSGAHSMLKEGGRLLISTPNEEDLSSNEVFCPECQHTFHRWQHLRRWSEESIRAVLEQYSFVVDTVHKTNFGLRKRDLAGRLRVAVARIASKSGPLPHMFVVARPLR